MKLFAIALAFIGAGALACPADDSKEAANTQDKPAAEAKAPVKAPATKAVASKKSQGTTKVADKSAAETARKSSL
ncbi:MAG TPA: hypothetical protein VFU71_06505 [Burkholderiaceae bacterium]|nr:hypothetical protein [Burkholderiaceae bacterium]